MGAREHGLLGVLARQQADGADKLVDPRQQHFLAGVLEHEAVREVVHILAGAGKVDKFGDGGQFRMALHLVLQVVLHRLHVVISGLLLDLDPLRLFKVETGDDGFEPRIGGGRERLHLRNARFCGQGLQPANLGNHAIAHQPVFRKYFAQRNSFFGVTAVDRGDGRKRGEIH